MADPKVCSSRSIHRFPVWLVRSAGSSGVSKVCFVPLFFNFLPPSLLRVMISGCCYLLKRSNSLFSFQTTCISFWIQFVFSLICCLGFKIGGVSIPIYISVLVLIRWLRWIRFLFPVQMKLIISSRFYYAEGKCAE